MCNLNLGGGGAQKQAAQAQARAAQEQTAIAQEQRNAEAERQRQIAQGRDRINSTFDSTFTPDFFTGRQNAYINYYTPQLTEQYNDALRGLSFALADAGLLSSSVASTRLGDLERDYGRRRTELASSAQGYAADTRNQVEGARSDLIQQMAGVGDANAAANAAVSRASALNTNFGANNFSPLAQLFQNVTAGIGAGQQAQQRVAALAARQPVTPRLFGAGGVGSGRVVT
jgi:hypothetical protein